MRTTLHWFNTYMHLVSNEEQGREKGELTLHRFTRVKKVLRAKEKYRGDSVEQTNVAKFSEAD